AGRRMGNGLRLLRVRVGRDQLHLLVPEQQRRLSISSATMRPMRFLSVAVLLLCALGVHAYSIGEHYELHAAHDADGIGKFYLGREIAQVMGPGGILWLERPERETEEQPQLVIDAFEIKPGQVIVDLGAGSGYYSFRIAPLVGPAGKVLAVDIEPTMLDVIAQSASREHVANIATVRSSARDPNLQ